MLFMPGTRADMIAKSPRFAADLVVVDLEDAVAPTQKAEARATAAAAINALGPADASTVLVRVNPVDTPWFIDDLAAAAASGAAGIVVPKLGSTQQLRKVHETLAQLSWSSAVIVGGIETALGVADARGLLAAGLSAAYFGAEDYIADIEGHRTADGSEVLYARSQVCLAAHLAAIPALDQAVVSIGDDEQFVTDARAGAALGYQGKICIHPRQVELAHRVFTPSPEEVAHAREVVAAGRAGVAVIDGQMVDDVHVRMAHAVLSRANEPIRRDGGHDSTDVGHGGADGRGNPQ